MNRVLVDSSSDLDEDAVNNETSVEAIIRALAKSTRMDITSSIDLSTASEYPCAGGSYCDVYRGKKYDGTKLAIKSLRVYQGPEAESQRRKILRHAVNELYLWSKLRHRNILPLIGLMLFRGRISIVSEWMENGNLVSFLLCHPDANRLCLCMDICVGLHYIHDNGMVHGDLKAANVMVSSRGVAMITDIGNAHLKDLTLRVSNTTSNSISVRWTAPELLQGTGSGVSKEADVYAFGITALEVLSGETPYKDLSDIQVLHWVAVEKGCPPRPTIDIRKDLWGVLVSCWSRNPTERPTIGKISHRLQVLHPNCKSHLQRLDIPVRVHKVLDDGHLPAPMGQVDTLEHSSPMPISCQLENKIVQLTQTLQQRNNERKAAENQIRDLECQLSTWQAKHEDAENRAYKLQTEVQTLHVPTAKFEELLKSVIKVEARFETKMAEQEAQISKLSAEVQAVTLKLERQAESNARDLGQIAALKQELCQVRDQLGRANALNSLSGGPRMKPSVSPTFQSNLKGHASQNEPVSGLDTPAGKRHRRIHSSAGAYQDAGVRDSVDERMIASRRSQADNPHSVLVAYNGHDGPQRFRNGPEEIRDELAEERIRLLSDLDRLDHEVCEGLITSLKLPSPTSTNVPSLKEVLFPANLISLISNEMWKYGMIKESERFLTNMMQTIQVHVMSFTGEDAIVPGVFWLSNVHEILSFVSCTRPDLTQGTSSIGNASGFDQEAYEDLIQMIESKLYSLEYNIYHSWMDETKKRLIRIIIPALIETQSLPGFIISEGAGRPFNRPLNQGSTPAFSMDDVLNLLNTVLESLKCFFMEESVIQRVMTELLQLVGVTSFNNLLMRRNFCSWKRAMQIRHNIARIEEWCKSHKMPEGALFLEQLIQATKLLQLKKATQDDIDIVYDVCWILTPSQIQRICENYFVEDHENPISPGILKFVAQRVQPNDRVDHLLLTPVNKDVTMCDLLLPREVSVLEHYVPAYLNVPHI